MTLQNPPPPPAPEPQPTDFTKWADYWYYNVGVNVIPADTKKKRTYEKWSQWQIKSIPEELFEEWKKQGAFNNGLAIIVGQVWRGPHEGKYFIFVDCDNRKAVDEICEIFGPNTTPQDVAQRFIVEQHKDNPNKAHIYFYSEIPFTKKSSESNNPNFKPEEQPAFEVKGRGSHGIAYCTPSLHQDGHPYEILGTTEPITLQETQATEMIQNLDFICRKYGLKYLEYDNGNNGDKALIPNYELFKKDFAIYEGQNRHEALLRVIEILVKRNASLFPDLAPIKQFAYAWNQACCKPPLDDTEFERQWKDGTKFIKRVGVFEEEEEEEEKEEEEKDRQPKQPPAASKLPEPSIPPAFRNDYFEYLVFCAQKTVKQESALIRQIDLTILSAYSADPNNLGILAPTSTGKSYPINVCVMFTPGGKEVRTVASMTPKVLVREQGVLVDKDRKPIGRQVRRLKAAIKTANKKGKFDEASKHQEELEWLLEDSAYILDLSGMVLIFLEPPHPELWTLLKPILSHDAYEMEHPYVDNIGHGIEVKRVITRGWPACIFCSAKDESKWEVWPEIESRFAISSPNMIKAKWEEGNKLIGQKKWLPRGVKQKVIISDKEVQLGKDCFLRLKHQIQLYKQKTDSPVWAPFGEYVWTVFPSDRGQDNRAFNRFTTFLNTIALCKAHLRYKVIFDEEELIIPSLMDLQETLHVMQNMTGLPPHKLQFYKQYILKLWETKHRTPLYSKDIVDYYNANNKDKKHPMNSENLRNTYLKELVNHNYLEQEQDESSKATKYLYTPLVMIEKDDEEQQKEEKEKEEKKDKQEPNNKPLSGLSVEEISKNLQYSKLILPKKHNGIPDNWLNLKILELSKALVTSDKLKIRSPEGNEVPIDEFVRDYEKEAQLNQYFTKPEVTKAS